MRRSAKRGLLIVSDLKLWLVHDHVNHSIVGNTVGRAGNHYRVRARGRVFYRRLTRSPSSAAPTTAPAAAATHQEKCGQNDRQPNHADPSWPPQRQNKYEAKCERCSRAKPGAHLRGSACELRGCAGEGRRDRQLG